MTEIQKRINQAEQWLVQANHFEATQQPRMAELYRKNAMTAMREARTMIIMDKCATGILSMRGAFEGLGRGISEAMVNLSKATKGVAHG